MNDIKLNKIKLIIWDLDDTFWNGTLSEGEVVLVQKNIDLIKRLTDRGLVNSICSKNDFEKVKRKMESIGIWDLFLMPIINWKSKGKQIKTLLSTVGLRDENVLFIDDNILNLKEAKFHNKNLMISLPDCIPLIAENIDSLGKDDSKHSRLNQYKIIETKQSLQTQNGMSDEDFLMSTHIKCEIFYDCINEKERLFELIHRTNQLNFTKFRQEKDDFNKMLIDAKIKSGYVKVSDDFGDYGICGFFSLDTSKNELIHFLFSCRTIGMGIEQWTYSQLLYPRITINGEVISRLHKNKQPLWINAGSGRKRLTKKDGTILFKGPCDLSGAISYLSFKNMISEFTYQDKAIGSAVQYSHTITVLKHLNRFDGYFRENFFGEADSLYYTKLFDENVDIVVWSMLIDFALGVYKNKKTGAYVVFGDYPIDFTDKTNWEKIIKGDFFTHGLSITNKMLVDFSENYEYIGLLDPQIFESNLEKIVLSCSNKKQFYFIGGAEIECTKNENPAYNGRSLVHKMYNKSLIKICNKLANCHYIDVNKVIQDDSCFTNSINHYNRKTLFLLAEYINKQIGGEGRKSTFIDKCFKLIRKIIHH